MRYSTPYGFFEIVPMPGQPQIAICHGLGVPTHLRDKGLGSKLKEAQNQLIAELLYDYAICSVSSTNAKQKHILAKYGWTRLDFFQNTRQSEETEIWGWKVVHYG